MFVMVTDEGEKTNMNGYNFAKLLAEYKKTVNPDLSLVIVRVGSGCSRFQGTLKANGIDYQLVLVDAYRPDHAKFDALLGQIALVMNKATEGRASTEIATGSSEPNNDEDFVVVSFKAIELK